MMMLFAEAKPIVYAILSIRKWKKNVSLPIRFCIFCRENPFLSFVTLEIFISIPKIRLFRKTDREDFWQYVNSNIWGGGELKGIFLIK